MAGADLRTIGVCLRTIAVFLRTKRASLRKETTDDRSFPDPPPSARRRKRPRAPPTPVFPDPPRTQRGPAIAGPRGSHQPAMRAYTRFSEMPSGVPSSPNAPGKKSSECPKNATTGTAAFTVSE